MNTELNRILHSIGFDFFQIVVGLYVNLWWNSRQERSPKVLLSKFFTTSTNPFFWGLTPCCLVEVIRRFGATCPLDLKICGARSSDICYFLSNYAASHPRRSLFIVTTVRTMDLRTHIPVTFWNAEESFFTGMFRFYFEGRI
jgi:hypothetical protein